MARVGVVAIGRNEGERLRRCLESLSPAERPTVYVDSGSTDGSRELARTLGADVVALDLSIPFTAARARNAGLDRLMDLAPSIEYVQFVDGDCEVDPGWWETASKMLDQNSETVVVCGRRRERNREASLYNRLCDLEWDTPAGEALACGGDALMRVSAVKAVGGYRPDLIAGEEPELCVRLRANGGRVVRIAAEMTQHDAAMTRFGQWWKRNVRAGHAFAEVSRVHAKSPFGIWKRETRSNWFWGLVVPVLAILPAALTWAISLVLLLGYPVLFWRVRRNRRRAGDDTRTARQFAFYCVLSKFPQVVGQMMYWRNRIVGRRGRLIEYKGPRMTG
ncbi:MAG TPA: glycosyltransferase family A protein [Gemmataceae bacterium]|nr:glycosyltransferase family A protein [Gemmataceae bacterium]